MSSLSELRKKACVIYNCRPARDFLKGLEGKKIRIKASNSDTYRGFIYDDAFLSSAHIQEAKEYIIKFEKKHGIGNYLNPKAIAALALRATLPITQTSVTKLLRISAVTIRAWENRFNFKEE